MSSVILFNRLTLLPSLLDENDLDSIKKAKASRSSLTMLNMEWYRPGVQRIANESCRRSLKDVFRLKKIYPDSDQATMSG